jgi:protein ImuB
MNTLWLCLHAPELALNALQPLLNAYTVPFVALAPGQQRQIVQAANQLAHAAGVRTGQSLAQARACLPELRAMVCDARVEQALLATLAGAAYRYSHQVHVMPELTPAVTLEVGASLKLFSGLDALVNNLSAAIKPLAITIAIGVAPTPYAALLLARIAKPGHIRIAKQFPSNLHALAISASHMPAAITSALASVGIDNLGALFALPRASLQKRYGKACIEVIKSLLGESILQTPQWQPARHFTRHMEFSFHIENVTALRFPLRRMLQELAIFLTACDGALQNIKLQLAHPRLPPSEIAIGFMAPTRDAGLMIELAEQKLEHCKLLASVKSMGLQVAEIMPAQQHTADLFAASSKAKVALPHFLERLQGKLGMESLRVLACKADHRPEYASVHTCLNKRSELPTNVKLPPELPERPFWLQEPAPIAASQFALLSGPERIESGWWDQDCIRNYYRAQHHDGRLLWVYQTPRDSTLWFLHGS